MRYFKAEIIYELISNNDSVEQRSQVLYCCSPTSFPKNEDLIELFYSLNDNGKNYVNASWKQVREEEIHTDEIHLLV